MKRKRITPESNSTPDNATPPYQVTHFRLDQFAAHQFMQTLRRHSAQQHRFDAPANPPAPHFSLESK